MSLSYEETKGDDLVNIADDPNKDLALYHLEHQHDGVTSKQQVLDDAIKAGEVERSLTFRQAIKLYHKSVFWSFAVSLVIIM